VTNDEAPPTSCSKLGVLVNITLESILYSPITIPPLALTPFSFLQHLHAVNSLLDNVFFTLLPAKVSINMIYCDINNRRAYMIAWMYNNVPCSARGRKLEKIALNQKQEQKFSHFCKIMPPSEEFLL
jgi:hypothetical protein